MGEADKAITFFDQFAEVFDTLYEGKRSGWMQFLDRKFRSDIYIRFQRTFEVLGDLEAKTVLDIGCGSGVYVMESLRRGAKHVVALDAAPAMLRLVRSRLQESGMEDRCEVVQGAFPEVSLQPADCVIVMGVMDYVNDAEEFLCRVRPLVRESAVLSFPSGHWVRTPLRKFRYTLRHCPVYFYDAHAIKSLARHAGFRTGEVYKIPGAGMDFHVRLQP